MKSRYIALAGLVISLIAIGSQSSEMTVRESPLVPISIETLSNNTIQIPDSNIFPKIESDFYWRGDVFEGFQKWKRVDHDKM